ncbi:BTAD domain-containing putative transcriptional regulator [Micromonospora sp. NPDC049559]|uniref:AfsR/SARP family transcriptional regulator n=1 Tax=Micromonospora sp. NPDC049559 TaxID=3155923 RepID=UPI00342D3366
MARPSGALRLAVLGPVLAWRGEVELDLGPPRQRATLAVLLAAAGKPMGLDEIVAVLWPENPPPGAGEIVRRYVDVLRRLLEPDLPEHAEGRRLVSSGGGYRLDLDEEMSDLLAFRRLREDARQALTEGQPELATQLFVEALRSWRGPAGSGIDSAVRAHPVFAALNREYLDAVRRAADAALAADQADAVLPHAEEAAEAQPLDEPLQARLVLLLAATGQRAAALEAYRRVRGRLAGERGVAPGPELQAAHAAVLRADADATAAARTSGETAPAWNGSRQPPGRPTVPFPEPTARPAQLPAGPAAFAGRRREIAELVATLAGTVGADGPDGAEDPVGTDGADGTDRPVPPPVVISGPAGVGKSALALHCAHLLAHRFPDGRLHVDLRGFDPTGAVMPPDEALHNLLGALGVPPRGVPVGLDAQVALYRGLLADRRVLVLLDNAHDAEQVRPLLPDAPGSLVIVTSRDQLPELVAAHGAHPIPLDVLDDADARDLLAGRLGTARLAAEPEAVEEMISLCARLPLALSLVAARAAMERHRPLATVARELRDAHDRADDPAGAAAGAARTALTWSYGALSPAAARLFRLFALHPSTAAGPAAVASLAGEPVGRIQPLLDELVRARLVTEPTPRRYAFHDQLRAYANGLVAAVQSEPERHAARNRLFDHYLHSALAADGLISSGRAPIAVDPPVAGALPEIFPRERDAVRWLVTERAALLAAVEGAGAHGFDVHAWQLAWVLEQFLERWGHWDDWTSAIRAGMRAAQRLDDPRALAHGHRSLGLSALVMGRAEDAYPHFTQALDLFRRTGDLSGQALVERGLASVVDRRGRYDEALWHAERAVALYREAGNRSGEGLARNLVGWYHATLGNYAAGLTFVEAAVALLRDAGYRRGEAAAWDTLGFIHRGLGEPVRAIEAYRRSAELRHEINDRHQEAQTLTRLGLVCRDSNDLPGAARALRQALTITSEMRHPDAEVIGRLLAEVEQMAGAAG